MNGYIKLDRKIMRWGWYKDNNTFKLWVHMLLCTYWDDGEYMGETIKAGSFPITYQELSEQTGMTLKQVRNCLAKLKKTGEIATDRKRYFNIITIVKWADYQGDRADKGQTKGNERAFKGQSELLNEEYKEYKNIRTNKYKYLDKLPVYDTSKNTYMDEDEATDLLKLMGRA